MVDQLQIIEDPFNRTYKELKPTISTTAKSIALSFNRTYKELKPCSAIWGHHRKISFNRTYKELKQHKSK